MVGLSTGSIIEEGRWSIAHVILDFVGRMVEAHIVETTSAAQGAAIQVVLSPLQPCGTLHYHYLTFTTVPLT